MTPVSLDTATTLENLTVADATLPGVVTCDPTASISTIAASMVIHDVRALMVRSAGGAALLVTELDLVRAALTRPLQTPAREVASEHAVSVTSDTSLGQAVSKMSELYVDHLLVTDSGSGEPRAVLSSFDVATAVVAGRRRRPQARLPVPGRSSASADLLSSTSVLTIMQMGVVSCNPGVSILTIARCMVERHIHCVAVAGVGAGGSREGHFEFGLVDDMDIVQAANRRALAESAGSIAIDAPLAVPEGDSIERAARLMVDEDARHAVVIGSNGLPSGMISTRDIAWMLAGAPRL
ncbi:MAG: CBS domain-containing protein [Solirubrobacteraceae bacterium]